MAGARIPTKRGALYITAETTAGTYVAPVQNSDKALRPLAMKLEVRGGFVDQNDDVSPAIGGGDALRDALGFRLTHSYRVPVWPDLNSLTAHPLAAVLNSCPGALSLLNTPDRVLFTPTNRFAPGTVPITVSLTFIELDGNVYTAKGGVSALQTIRTESQAYLVFEFITDFQARDSDGDSVQATSATAFTTAAAEYVSESYVNPKGRTLTLTNVDGSAVICSDSFALSTGMELVDTPCGNATNGYGISGAAFTGPCVLAASVYALPELATGDGRQFWETWFAAEDVGISSIVCGSGASAFTLATSKSQIIDKPVRKDINGMVGYDLAVKFKSSTLAALDHLLLTWGA